MKTEKSLNLYETPQAEVINLELEQAVLQGSEKDDPDITIPGMGWGY